MNFLKNPFAAKSTPPTDPPETDSLDAAEKAKKRWELEHGRTRAKVASLTADLDTARADLAHATQAAGVAIYEEQDSTAEALAAQQAALRVAALEAALAVAIQKDDAAQVELQQAEGDLKVAQREEIHQRLCTMAAEGEELFIRIKLFRAELVRELAALQELGGRVKNSATAPTRSDCTSTNS